MDNDGIRSFIAATIKIFSKTYHLKVFHINAFNLVSDEEFAEKLRKEAGWKQGTGDFLEDMLILTYEGQRYYRDIVNVDTADDIVYENIADPGNTTEIYVTSIVFEAEPEFASEDIEDIRNVLSILGKHVYNSREGDSVMLKVE